jgi:hypothetical protein
MKVLKAIIFLMLPFHSLCQEKNNFYEITGILNDNYYYNVVLLDNHIYFGSSDGVIYYTIEKKKTTLYDNKIKGNIRVLNNQIIGGRVDEDNSYDFLLPEQYKNGSSNYLIYNSYLIIVSKGVAFIFKITKKNLETFPSTRSISENYVATYGGIFNRKEKKYMSFPSYSNGYVKEFEKEVFINWDGLTIYKDSTIINLFDPIEKDILINNKNLGKARDIINNYSEEYILFTTKGLYSLNSISLDNKIKIKASNGVFNYLNEERYNGKLLNLYFNDDFNFYQYDLKNDKLKVLMSFEKIIKDISYDLKNYFFVLHEDKLVKYFLNNTKQETVIENLNLTHNIDKFKNFIYITSDLGLTLYDLKTKTFKINVIKDEFNNYANYKNNDILYLGSTNGVYKLSYDDIIELFYINKKIPPNDDLIMSKSKVYAMAFTILLIVITGYYFLKKHFKKQFTSSKNAVDINELLIRTYVRDHLNTVNISSICDEFKLSTNKLYSILNKTKPGDIIREERLKVVRRMRIQNVSEIKISKITGFSLSYLKKII